MEHKKSPMKTFYIPFYQQTGSCLQPGKEVQLCVCYVNEAKLEKEIIWFKSRLLIKE